MESLDFARTAASAIGALGGSFMLDPATTERGEQLGLDFASFYGLGRASVLGDAPAEVAAAAYPFIPPELAKLVWAGARAKVEPSEALAAYSEACHAWGRANLADCADLERLCGLLAKLVDSADGFWGALFAGWRGAPRPDDAPALAAQLSHVLRELHGCIHVAALLCSPLRPEQAAMVAGGAAELAQYFWPEPYPDPAEFRDEYDRVMADTDANFARVCQVLDDEERAELAGLLLSAEAQLN